jgi:hypothetical protein
MKKLIKDGVSIERGEVFYLKKLSLIVIVISNKLHNLLSKHLTVILATDKNVEQVQESLEVNFELKEKKLKIVVSCLYTIDKQTLLEEGNF